MKDLNVLDSHIEQEESLEQFQQRTRNSLKPYQPYGIPMLKFLFGLTMISLVVTAIYEFVL